MTFRVDNVVPATEMLPTQPLGELFPETLVMGGDIALPVLVPSGVHPLLDVVARAGSSAEPRRNPAIL